MARAFIVVRESGALMPDGDDGFLKLDKALRGHPAVFNSGRLGENGVERVLRKDVFDVGNEKLLVLLFVVKAQDQHRLDLREERVVRVAQ
jgi:hypothetical protein